MSQVTPDVRVSPIVMPPAEALQALLDGNARFVRHRTNASVNAALLATLAEAQQPFAMVFGCADSRVPPVHVFDQPPGAIFACRTAGHVLEPVALGSFEYAVSVIGSPSVLLVLAHERCGAVTAASDAQRRGGRAAGSIQAIVDGIVPAIEAVDDAAHGDDAVGAIARAHARMTAEALPARSAILAGAVAAGQLAIVPAYCSFTTGAIELL